MSGYRARPRQRKFTATSARPRNFPRLAAYGGSLYATLNSVAPIGTGLYEIDIVTPANTRRIGELPDDLVAPEGLGLLISPLTTSFIREGSKLFYTNARVDARVATWARASAGVGLDGRVLRSDGTTAFWGESFHLFNEVTTVLQQAGLATDDRIMLADVSLTGSPNRATDAQ